jgi:hypothetical protein
MNIIDMPFFASGLFPTNEVENSRWRRKKFGKSPEPRRGGKNVSGKQKT